MHIYKSLVVLFCTCLSLVAAAEGDRDLKEKASKPVPLYGGFSLVGGDVAISGLTSYEAVAAQFGYHLFFLAAGNRYCMGGVTLWRTRGEYSSFLPVTLLVPVTLWSFAQKSSRGKEHGFVQGLFWESEVGWSSGTLLWQSQQRFVASRMAFYTALAGAFVGWRWDGEHHSEAGVSLRLGTFGY